MGMEKNKKPAAEFRREITSWSEMLDHVNETVSRMYKEFERLGYYQATLFEGDGCTDPPEEGVGAIVPVDDRGLGQSGSAD